MGNLTSEQHQTDKALAAQLIDNGRVQSWQQLGKAFGISGQAAHSRFGPKGYGLEMPKRTRQQRRMVSVSLGPTLDGQLEEIRNRWPGDPVPTRARVARLVLERELARYAENVDQLA